MSNREHKITGRAWIITESGGGLFPNIDTDMIYHNNYLAITDVNEMGQYSFDNLEGWKDFAKQAKPGDIVIAGSNFGCGSSRQQAVDCFSSLGVRAVIAESFGAIYFRNGVNSGFPLIKCPDLKSPDIKHFSEIELDFDSGEIKDSESGELLATTVPMSGVQKSILDAGNMFVYGKNVLK